LTAPDPYPGRIKPVGICVVGSDGHRKLLITIAAPVAFDGS
jgi:hypothetical protein